jgi:hypothetical protein
VISPERLRPRRRTQVLLLATSAIFVAIGVAMIRSGEDLAMAWAATSFFGLCALVFSVQLLPNSSWLEIHPDRLELCTLFRRARIEFGHVRRFSVERIGRTRMVTLEFREDAPSAQGRAFAKLLAGAEGALPDTYGLSPEELSGRLNEALRRWAGGSSYPLPSTLGRRQR